MTLDTELAALEKMSVADLVERYAELWGKPTRTRNRRHLFKRCAWKLQENRFGGLSKTARQKLEEIIGDLEIPTDAPRAPQNRDGLAPGAILTKTWRDTEIQVQVHEDGFEWNGDMFRSLSAVTRAITGTRWNGPLFFGLRS